MTLLAWKCAATVALSAAARRPDDETLRILESVPLDAWVVTPVISAHAEILQKAIRYRLTALIEDIRHEFCLEADPDNLADHCEVLIERWKDCTR